MYRATDSTLHREVAIKVISPEFASDPERMARFEREAQVLASLTHGSIAAVYGLERSDGQRALVMELVEGEDLSARLRRGPVEMNDALRTASYSRKPSKLRTSTASSTAISSPPTSSCSTTGT